MPDWDGVCGMSDDSDYGSYETDHGENASQDCGGMVISESKDSVKTDEFGRELVLCGLCGKYTPMTGTKRCDRCWELENRVLADVELTKKILADNGK